MNEHDTAILAKIKSNMIPADFLDHPDQNWYWSGAWAGPNGEYATVYYKGKTHRLQRWLYKLLIGPLTSKEHLRTKPGVDLDPLDRPFLAWDVNPHNTVVFNTKREREPKHIPGHLWAKHIPYVSGTIDDIVDYLRAENLEDITPEELAFRLSSVFTFDELTEAVSRVRSH